jgi:hypothetical protein
MGLEFSPSPKFWGTKNETFKVEPTHLADSFGMVPPQHLAGPLPTFAAPYLNTEAQLQKFTAM